MFKQKYIGQAPYALKRWRRLFLTTKQEQKIFIEKQEACVTAFIYRAKARRVLPSR